VITLIVTALVLVALFAYLIFRGERRVALTFAVAPLAAPIIGTVETLDLRTLMVMSAFSYPLSLLTGVPAYFLFRRLGWLQIWTVLLASAILGGAIALVLFGVHGGFDAVGRTMLFSAFGAATGLVFWLIAFADLRSNNRWRGP
jgi:hypothetical protein